MENKKTGIFKYFVFLHILLFFNSFTGICSKLAAHEKLFSFKFLLLYGTMIFILGIYAIFWQQVLKHIPLTTAFCNKAVSIVWGIVWGCTIFKEELKWNMIVGAVIVIIGVIVVVTSDEH